MGGLPRLVLSIQDLLPSREHKTGDIGDARFDPLAMLACVATDHLDLHEFHRLGAPRSRANSRE